MRGVVAALAGVALLGACGGEDAGRDEVGPAASARERAPDAPSGGVAPASVPAPGPPPPEAFLVEVVYEAGFASLAEPARAPAAPRGDAHDAPAPLRGDASGYVLRRLGPSLPPVLYPARERPVDPDREARLWVARRARLHPLLPGSESASLEAAESGSHRSAFGGHGLLPGLSVELDLADGGSVTARSADARVALAPGETAVVARAEAARDADALADGLFASWREAGVTALPGRDRVRADLRALAGDGAALRVHARLVVHHRGGVRLAPFDVRHEREEARRLLREGPYELAEEALENVLEARPQDAEALAAWRRVGELLDAGASPGHLRGMLRFPAGAPTDEQRALWTDFHAGFAWLERPNAPEGRVYASASVEDGAFSLEAPAGEYRLRVAVPGFALAGSTVAVGADSVVELRLEAP